MNKLKSEVLRYLAYKNQPLDENINNLIDSTLKEAIELKNRGYKYTYRAFNISFDKKGVLLENSDIYLFGNDIYRHLNNSEKCILIAATLGIDFERAIIYNSKINITKALILDACGTALIEGVLDEIEMELLNSSITKDLQLTGRYSPGYGDFPIESQRDMALLLNTERCIGVTVSPSHILIPRKSVTAVIGLYKDKAISCFKTGCKSCNISNCEYKE
ncbi:hypothetical protein F8154_11755 [Alkaliphilus pronyensis]|uniref:Methionine synthase n=1 Tax=Alkaliphilus pronyensis TaxID=1482732 RepID=A0A6I0EZM0_9FIRM|nr:hypothetical protein [Alkaliphilus pronyensis]KAB3532542.1 hypothetical protein F8154_11755 [Alkaliphilus pronyensis]